MKTTTTVLSLAAALGIAQTARAQVPLLTMTPGVSLAAGGNQIQWRLAGPIASPHAILADVRGGPTPSFGETFLLGLSPATTTLHFALSSAMPQSGTVQVPPVPGLIGAVIFAQSAVLTPSAPNGLFELGNGASSIIHAGPSAIVVDFADPVGQGFRGNFRADIVGHIRGGPVLHRTKDTLSPAGAIFGVPIQSPLVPMGCREQMVFRAAEDLGAIGEPEVVTAVRWLARGVVQSDTFLQFELRMGHTHVVPDYSIDPWSALAVAPGSGLTTLFAANEMAGAPPVTVFTGRYDVDPLDAVLTPLGRFMPYPGITPFHYDGVSSLLLDFRVGQGVIGINGMTVQLMVQSGPLPAARAVAGGTWPNPVPIPNPSQVTQANAIDCAMPILQFDFARVETHAESPWLAAGTGSPDYGTPLLAASKPAGTAVDLRFRGSYSASSTGATAWSSTPDIADGMPFLQIDVVLRGHPITNEVPIVDTFVVPVH